MASITDFEYIMSTVLGQKKDSPLSLALEDGGIDSIADIMSSTDSSIDRLKWRDPSFLPVVKNTISPKEDLNDGLKTLVRAFKAFVLTRIEAGNPIHDDWQNSFPNADFQEFRFRFGRVAPGHLNFDKTCIDFDKVDDSHALAFYGAFFGLDDKNGIQVSDIVPADSIPSEIPSEPTRLGSRLSSLDGDLFERDHGITPASIPSDVVTDDPISSEPPDGLGPRLSSSADDFFEQSATSRLGSRLSSSVAELFEYDHGITPVSIPSDVVTDDPIPSEPPDGLSSRLSSSADDLFEDDNGITHDHGITPVSIPSEPPGVLGSRLSSLAVDLLKHSIPSEPPELHSRLSSTVCKNSWGAVQEDQKPSRLGSRLSRSADEHDNGILGENEFEALDEIPSKLIAIETLSEPPGPGLIPSEPR
jgi:hypothetical protein